MGGRHHRGPEWPEPFVHEPDCGFAFNFRVTAERGASGESGYIASIQGGFQ